MGKMLGYLNLYLCSACEGYFAVEQAITPLCCPECGTDFNFENRPSLIGEIETKLTREHE